MSTQIFKKYKYQLLTILFLTFSLIGVSYLVKLNQDYRNLAAKPKTCEDIGSPAARRACIEANDGDKTAPVNSPGEYLSAGNSADCKAKGGFWCAGCSGFCITGASKTCNQTQVEKCGQTVQLGSVKCIKTSSGAWVADPAMNYSTKTTKIAIEDIAIVGSAGTTGVSLDPLFADISLGADCKAASTHL